jgi:hypothetical protein
MGVKKIPFIIAAFILVVSIFLFLIPANQAEESAATILQKAFSATGATAVTSEVYLRGRLAPGAFESMKERRGLLEAILRGAGGKAGTREPAFSEIDTDDSSGTQLNYIISNDSTLHASVLQERQKGAAGGSQVSVSLVSTAREQGPAEEAGRLESLLKQYCTSTSVNICITGRLDGELDSVEADDLCDRILESTGADEVEGLQGEKLVSVSAFSPSIENSIRVNGKRINLNVAVRYNSYEGKTYIWLATPVITTEY